MFRCEEYEHLFAHHFDKHRNIYGLPDPNSEMKYIQQLFIVAYYTFSDDKKANPKAEKSRDKQEKPKNQEREMPKLKEVEPPNFASSNKYAFLQAEDDSDE